MKPSELGERIRLARERAGISQDDLAIAVGKDRRAVYEYEHGKRKVFATDLSLFARALNVPVSYFYEGRLEADALEQVMIEEFRGLPTTKAKEAAVHFLRIFSDAVKNQLG